MSFIKLPQNPFIVWVEKRIQRNKNCIIMINGGTGSGKTYGALDFAIKLSKQLDTHFSVTENMDFNFKDLLKKMQLPTNEKPGTVFLFEEVGAVGGGASYREWQSKANSFFHSFMQTSRHKNQILMMTTPQFAYLQKGVRELTHLQITMKSINPQNKTSTGKPFILQTNPISGKVYFKYLRVRYKGMPLKVKEITFNLPPKDLLKEYEQLKTKFTNNLNKSMMVDDEPKSKTAKSTVDMEKLLAYKAKGMNKTEMAALFGVSTKTIQRRMSQARIEGLL